MLKRLTTPITHKGVWERPSQQAAVSVAPEGEKMEVETAVDGASVTCWHWPPNQEGRKLSNKVWPTPNLNKAKVQGAKPGLGCSWVLHGTVAESPQTRKAVEPSGADSQMVLRWENFHGRWTNRTNAFALPEWYVIPRTSQYLYQVGSEPWEIWWSEPNATLPGIVFEEVASWIYYQIKFSPIESSIERQLPEIGTLETHWTADPSLQHLLHISNLLNKGNKKILC